MLLGIFMVGVSLLASELVLRGFFSYRGNVHKLFCEYDPLLGWRKLNNHIGTHSHPEYEIVERTNSMGIRGPEYPIQKPDDEYRILVLGDSFAQGYMVAFEQMFSEVAKRVLNTASDHRPVEVINAGTGGYSTDQEYLYFNHEGHRFQPDLTVLAFYQNDVFFNSVKYFWRGPKPQFRLENGELTLTNVPVQKIRIRLTQRVFDWLRQRLYLVQYAGIARIELMRRVGPAKQSFADERLGIYQNHYSDGIEEAWDVTEALLAALASKVKAAGSHLLVLYVPARFEVYPGAWREMADTQDWSDEAVSVDQVRLELRSRCERHGIELLDPTEAMREDWQQGSAGSLYFEIDQHWNAAGNRFVGELLGDFLAPRLDPRHVKH